MALDIKELFERGNYSQRYFNEFQSSLNIKAHFFNIMALLTINELHDLDLLFWFQLFHEPFLDKGRQSNQFIYLHKIETSKCHVQKKIK